MHGKALGGVSTLILLCATTMGCSSSTSAPKLPSSSGQTSYAIHYNEELQSATKSVADAQAQEKKLSGGFNAHVDELKKPDWSKVETIVDDSDTAGKSADFAEASSDATAVRSFWDSEKNEITGKVNFGAQHTLKQAGCNADTNGPISYAIDDAIKKSLQKKLRSKNEAFVVIERYKTSLGPQNVQSLEKLADEVSEASYTVNVLMVNQHNRVKRLADDRSDVKKTLDKYIEDETKFQQEPGRSEAEKKASQDRITVANKNKAEIDSVGQQADQVSKDMEKTIDASKKEYEEALKAIKAKIADKKKNEPPPPPGAKPLPPPAPPPPESKSEKPAAASAPALAPSAPNPTVNP